MSIRKTTGIILAKRKSGEADQLATILTRDFGKMFFVFKGLRKSRSRPRIASEPGTVLDLQFYDSGRNAIPVVSEFSLFRNSMELRKDLDRIYNLLLMLEITDRTTGTEDSGRSLFDLLFSGLETLGQTDYACHLALFYTLHFLRLQGLYGGSMRCTRCGKTDFEEFIIDAADFSPLCRSCSGSLPVLAWHGPSAKRFLAESMNRKFVAIEPESYDHSGIIRLLLSTVMFIEHYYHIEIKSKSPFLSAS